jgi:hypothetical protein
MFGRAEIMERWGNDDPLFDLMCQQQEQLIHIVQPDEGQQMLAAACGRGGIAPMAAGVEPVEWLAARIDQVWLRLSYLEQAQWPREFCPDCFAAE